jgi:hypothetical protein
LCFKNGHFPTKWAKSLKFMFITLVPDLGFEPRIMLFRGRDCDHYITSVLHRYTHTFGMSCNKRCWYILFTFGPFYSLFGIFYGHLVHFIVFLVYFMDIWSILKSFGYILWTFGRFKVIWFFIPRKIWQPCSHQHCDMELHHSQLLPTFCTHVNVIFLLV